MAPDPRPGHTPGSPQSNADGLRLAIDVLRAWITGGSCPSNSTAEARRAAAALLARNRLLGLVGDLLLQAGADPEVWSAISAFRRLTAQMNGANLLLMRRLFTLLAEIERPVVVYKGVVLQNDLYGTPFARPASDVDLLTHPEDYGSVAAAFQTAGYRLNPHTDTLWWRRFLAEQQFRRGDEAQSIDLHHRIQQPGCPMPRRPERLITHARMQPFIGGAFLTFDPRHRVLVAAMSLAKSLHHREPAGRYLGDLGHLLTRIPAEDWDALRQEAVDQGLSGTLDLARRCVAAVFGIEVGPSRGHILSEVSDTDLQLMLLAPEQAVWIRRRRLLQAICDRPADILTSWLVMAASESARLTSAPSLPREPV